MQETGKPGVIDVTDLRILERLQQDASQSNQDLAEQCGISAATCLRRVRRLVETGVIERRVAVLSPERLGGSLTGIVEVTLDHQGAEHLTAFERRAIAEPSVQQCYRVSGGPDFVIIAQAADMAGWAALVERLFTQDANVRNVKTFFALRRTKFDLRIALPGRAAT